MKVLQIIDDLGIGGAERIFIDLANWLFEFGINIEVVVIIGNEIDMLEDLNPGIPFHVLNRKNRFDLHAAKKLANHIRKSDIVHIHMRHNFRYAMAISTLGLIKSKIVLHDHFGSINIDSSVPFGYKTFSRPKFYIGVSMPLINWAVLRLKLPKERIFLLENCVSKLKAPPKKNATGLVLVSNIKPQKNQLFAIELLSCVDEKLTIYGGIQDLTYYTQIQEKISHRNLSKRVKHIENVTNIQSILGHYRLGLHTSVTETGPITIIEYLAQGLPFLAYKTGEAARIIQSEFPEYFIENFEIEAWQGRIKELLRTSPDREKMNWFFEKHFSKKKYIGKCLNIYKTIQNY